MSKDCGAGKPIVIRKLADLTPAEEAELRRPSRGLASGE